MWANESDSSLLRDNRFLKKVGLQIVDRNEGTHKRRDLLNLLPKLPQISILEKDSSEWGLLPDN